MLLARQLAPEMPSARTSYCPLEPCFTWIARPVQLKRRLNACGLARVRARQVLDALAGNAGDDGDRAHGAALAALLRNGRPLADRKGRAAEREEEREAGDDERR